MYQKQNGLATNGANFRKIYIIENKIVINFVDGKGRGKKGD